MNIQVKQTEEIEINAIQHLLNAEIQGRILNKRYEKLIVAYEKTSIVGIGVIWLNKMHPYAQYAAIICDQNGRIAQTQDALFEEIRRTKGEFDRIIFSFWETDEKMVAFNQRHSLKLLRKTYFPKLEIALLINSLDHLPTLTMNQLYTLNEVLNDSNLKYDFLQLLKATYEETHLVNPAANLSITQWKPF